MKIFMDGEFKRWQVLLSMVLILLCISVASSKEVFAASDEAVSDGTITQGGAVSDGAITQDGVVSNGAITQDGVVSDGAITQDGVVSDGAITQGKAVSDGAIAQGEGEPDGIGASDGKILEDTDSETTKKPKKKKVKKGLLKEGGAYYYYKAGKRLKNSWKKLNGYKYYFTSSGKAATLSRKINGIYYIFRKNGHLVKPDCKSTVKIAGKIYVVSKSGKALSGWNILNNRLYFAKKNGTCISGGTRGNVRFSKKGFAVNSWKKLDGKKYYFKSHGKMAVSSTKIQEQYYIFSLKGRLLQPQQECIRRVGENKFHVTPDGIGKSDWFIYRDKLYYSTKSGRCISNRTKNDICFNEKCEAIDSMATRQLIKNLLSVEGLSDLKAQLEALIGGYNGTHCIYVKNLNTYEWMAINNMEMRPASLIKLYNMGTVYQLIKEGRLTETDYINSNLKSMITVSSNDAYNNLLVQIGNGSAARGIDTVNEFNQQYGFSQTLCGGTLSPSSSRSVWLYRSHTSVLDCGNILEDIYRGCLVDEESSKKMLDLLLQQQRKWKIPSGLPQGVVSANKTGEVYDFQHDAAIVFSDKADYIITVMTQGDGSAISHIGSISRVVYDYFN